MEINLGLLNLIYRQTQKREPVTFYTFKASGASSADALKAIQALTEAGAVCEAEAGVFFIDDSGLEKFFKKHEPPKATLSVSNAKIGAEAIHKTNSKDIFIKLTEEPFGCKPKELGKGGKNTSSLGSVMRMITAKLLKMEDGIVYCAIDEKSVTLVLQFLSELQAKNVKRAKTRDHTHRRYELEAELDAYRSAGDYSADYDEDEEEENDYAYMRNPFENRRKRNYVYDEENEEDDEDEDNIDSIEYDDISEDCFDPEDIDDLLDELVDDDSDIDDDDDGEDSD